MAKEKKAKPKAVKTIEMSAEDKKALKAKMKAAKTDRDTAIAAKDKKKVKAARKTAKKINLKLKRTKVLAAPEAPKEAKAE